MRLSLFALCFVLVSCQDSIRGSGNIVSEERALDTFEAIDASNSVEVFVRQGAAQRVTVRAEDNVLGRVRTEVRQGTLRVGLRPGNYQNATTEITVELPTLRALSASGSVDAKLSGFTNLDALDVSTSGSSDVEASGSARTLTLDLSGLSDFRGFNFTAEVCRVSASGASDVKITCTDLLEGSLSGSSDLTYRGRPDLNVSTSGSSDINDRN